MPKLFLSQLRNLGCVTLCKRYSLQHQTTSNFRSTFYYCIFVCLNLVFFVVGLLCKTPALYWSTNDPLLPWQCWQYVIATDNSYWVFFTDLSYRLPNIKHLYGSDVGCNVFILSYRGFVSHCAGWLIPQYANNPMIRYGKSEGTPTEQGLQIDAQAALDYLMSHPDIDTNKIGNNMSSSVSSMSLLSPSSIYSCLWQIAWGSCCNKADSW